VDVRIQVFSVPEPVRDRSVLARAPGVDWTRTRASKESATLADEDGSVMTSRIWWDYLCEKGHGRNAEGV
jgi:hypothetical protein